MNFKKVMLLILVIGITTSNQLSAEVPATLTWQGRLLDADGAPVNGIVPVTARLFDSFAGGVELWSETQDVECFDSFFDIHLGIINPLDLTVFGSSTDEFFLEIQVGADPPMTPRFKLNSVPFSSASQGVRGDITTAPGQINVLDPDDDDDGIDVEVDDDEASLRLYGRNPQTGKEIKMAANPDSGSFKISNLGSSGLDGVSIAVGDDINVGLSKADAKRALEGSVTDNSVSLSFIDSTLNDSGLIDLRLDGNGSSIRSFNVDSFFDIHYEIDLSTSGNGAHLNVSNIGSSGEDGVSMDVDRSTSRLKISNLGSSGQDGVSIATDSSGSGFGISRAGVDRCGISVDDNTSSSFMVDSFFDIEYRVDNSTSGQTFSQTGLDGIPRTTASYGRSGNFNIDSFFDIEYRIDNSVSDTGAISSSSVTGNGVTVKQLDKSTPLLAQSLCSFDNGTDSHSAEMRADGVGSGVFAIDSFFDIEYRMDNTPNGVTLSRALSGADPEVLADYGRSGNFNVDSFFDIEYRIDNNVSDTGAISAQQATGIDISSKRIDKASPLLAKSLCSFDNGFDSHSAEMRAEPLGSGMFMVDSFFDIEYRCDLTPQSGLHLHDASGDTTASLSRGRFKVGTELSGKVNAVGDDNGGNLTVSNIGSSGEDGVSVEADDTGTSLFCFRQEFGQVQPDRKIELRASHDAAMASIRNMRASMPPDSDTSSIELLADDFNASIQLKKGDDVSLIGFGTFTMSKSVATAALDTNISMDNDGNAHFNGLVGIGTDDPVMTLDVRGEIGCNALVYHSDKRWKRNINPVTNALEKVNRLRGVSYEWRKDEFPEMNFTDDSQIGLIAQEVESVLPELVTTDQDGYKSVEYANLVAVLIEAVKQQQQEINGLKNQLEKVEYTNNQVDDLQQKINRLQVLVNTIMIEQNSSPDTRADLISGN